MFDQGNLIQGKAQLALKNWKNLFGEQKEDSLTSLEVCYLLKGKQISAYHMKEGLSWLGKGARIS